MRSLIHNQDGAVSIWMAVLMLPLILLSLFMIDTGMLLVSKSKIENYLPTALSLASQFHNTSQCDTAAFGDPLSASSDEVIKPVAYLNKHFNQTSYSLSVHCLSSNQLGIKMVFVYNAILFEDSGEKEITSRYKADLITEVVAGVSNPVKYVEIKKYLNNDF